MDEKIAELERRIGVLENEMDHCVKKRTPLTNDEIANAIESGIKMALENYQRNERERTRKVGVNHFS